MRTVGDPEADRVVAELDALGEWSDVNRLLHALPRNDAPLPADLRPSLRTFLEESAQSPVWADPDAIAVGQELRYGLFVVIALHCASLPCATPPRTASASCTSPTSSSATRTAACSTPRNCSS